MDSILSQAFNGLSLASILLLVALGLAFSFGLMGVINMAHGEFLMVGAYTAFLFQQSLAGALGGVNAGVWFVLALLAAFVVCGALGGLLEVGLIRFLYGRPLDTLLATWGAALMLQQAARSIFGAPNVQVDRPHWLKGSLAVTEGLQLPYARLFIIALAALCVVLVYLYLNRTAAGRRLRAVMQNREMASCLGVPTRRVDAATFALGGALAGVAGCVLTLIGPVGPSLGTYYIVDAFLVVILGGVGRLPGTILAALVIGVGNTFLEMGTTATLGKVLILGLVIAFLQWKPSGLVGARGR